MCRLSVRRGDRAVVLGTESPAVQGKERARVRARVCASACLCERVRARVRTSRVRANANVAKRSAGPPATGGRLFVVFLWPHRKVGRSGWQEGELCVLKPQRGSDSAKP